MDKVLEGIKVFFSRVLRPAVTSFQPPIYWVLDPGGYFTGVGVVNIEVEILL
jgi:hypothetical protein